MLQIFIKGKKDRGFLDLNPGSALDMEMLSELFDDDLTLGEYSLPLDAPLTPNNRRLLGFPDLINNIRGSSQEWYEADVWADGMPVRFGARLTIQSISTGFGNNGRAISITIAGHKGIFGAAVQGKYLTDIAFDDIQYSVPARTFATNVMKAAAGYNMYPYLKFAPVVIQNYFDTERPEYNSEFLIRDTVNHVVSTGGGANDWQFNSLNADADGPATTGTDEYLNHRTVPFFSYKFILQRLFATFGYTITGQWIDDPAWDALFMFNTCSLEQYNLTLKTDVSNHILPRMHMPKKLIGEFLRDLQMAFCVRFSFQDGNIVRMDYRKRDLASRTAFDATHITTDVVELTIPEFRKNGFRLSFEFDSDDAYAPERMQDINEKNLVATVSQRTELASLVIGRAFNFNDIVYVKCENQYYCYSNGAGPDAWEPYSEGLMERNIGAGGREFKSGISPMATYLTYLEDIDRLQTSSMVGADQKGCYYNRNNVPVSYPFATRMFFIGKETDAAGNNVPVSYVHNRRYDGAQRAPVSLSFIAEGGLYDYCWREWIAFLSDTQHLKVQMFPGYTDVLRLSEAARIRIAGNDFLLYKRGIRFPLGDSLQDVELYKL